MTVSKDWTNKKRPMHFGLFPQIMVFFILNRPLIKLFDKIMIFNITLWRKISATKFQKSKMDATLKITKVSILFCKFLQENMVYRKNGEHHDEANEKSFETVISNFLFLKLCHRDFSSQSNVKNHDFIKKSVQFSIFLEHPLVYLIESNKSTARDWTNKKRPMQFWASLSSGEVLEWTRFYDKSIVGMYLLVLSSHIVLQVFEQWGRNITIH